MEHSIGNSRRIPGLTHKVCLLKSALADVHTFSQAAGELRLRSYQQQAAQAVLDSVVQHLGMTLVIMFPRQSGKNEIQAQIENYLLTALSMTDAEIIKISPTWKPQSQNAMNRLERLLKKNLLIQGNWKKEAGYIYRVGQARMIFLSGSPETNIVGATASTLLEIDEAQDVQIAKYDKDIAPMAASTNATRIFWGTAWTSKTLLARELKVARREEEKDGRQRVFIVSAEDVGKEVPAYKKFVEEQVARLGRQHPLIKTQYFAEEIDAEGGMFNAQRMALMQGTHAMLDTPADDCIYAAMLDIAGEDEGAADVEQSIQVDHLRNPKRDLTALTVVHCDLATVKDELIRKPTYRVVKRYQWIGIKHSTLYGQLHAILDHWRVRWAVVDATGIGAGIASFLQKAYKDRVIPFVFTSASKSRLGWDYLAVCDSGRWKEYEAAGEMLQQTFWRQCQACEYEVMESPGKMLRWGVPEGLHDPETGEWQHDDLLVSAAMSAVLDGQTWHGLIKAEMIHADDPLDDLTDGF